jgi:hypothetical protein
MDDKDSHQTKLLMYLKQYISQRLDMTPTILGKKVLEMKNLDMKNVYGLETVECLLIYDPLTILNTFTFKVVYKITDFLPLNPSLKLYCYIEGKNLNDTLIKFIKHISEKVYCRDCGKLRTSSEFVKDEDQCMHCIFETLILYENKETQFCCICQQKTPRYIRLQCGHIYHRKCVSKLIKNKCPLCNAEIEHIDI